MKRLRESPAPTRPKLPGRAYGFAVTGLALLVVCIGMDAFDQYLGLRKNADRPGASTDDLMSDVAGHMPDQFEVDDAQTVTVAAGSARDEIRPIRRDQLLRLGMLALLLGTATMLSPRGKKSSDTSPTSVTHDITEATGVPVLARLFDATPSKASLNAAARPPSGSLLLFGTGLAEIVVGSAIMLCITATSTNRELIDVFRRNPIEGYHHSVVEVAGRVDTVWQQQRQKQAAPSNTEAAELPE